MSLLGSASSAPKTAATRRFAAPRLEVLEDRLAPAGGLFEAAALLKPPSGPEVDLQAVERAMTGAHLLSTAVSSRLSVARQEGFPRLTAFRANPGRHPLLAALLNARHDGGVLGDTLPRFSFSGSPPLGVGPASSSALTMIVAPQNLNPDPLLHYHPAAAPVRSDLAGPPNPLPPPGDGMGFSPFVPSLLMSPRNDRPMKFELSPYAPSGLDIVPVPVPSGLADLLGDPPRDTVPDNLFSEGRASDDAVRDAVAQMLRESWAPPGLLDAPPSRPAKDVVPPPAPLPPSVSYPPSADADEAVEVAHEASDEEAPAAPIPRRSMLAAVVAGLGFAGWHNWRCNRRTRDVCRDPARARPCP
jgi:hypothetical protein